MTRDLVRCAWLCALFAPRHWRATLFAVCWRLDVESRAPYLPAAAA